MDNPAGPRRRSAIAHPNLALVKYWGKRDRNLNLPATGSLSVTLGGFKTKTTVEFMDRPGTDEIILDGKPADGGTAARVSRFLDLVRSEAGVSGAAIVRTYNDFPTASGLASSSAGFAALAVAACNAAGLDPNPAELSLLARRGSGSAARSIFGGFVEMLPGKRSDGIDSVASQLWGEDHWDLRIIVALTSIEDKPLGSGEGMEITAASSPYYNEWIRGSEADLDASRSAVAARDLNALGEIAEHSALKMHAAAMASRPPVIYWWGGTIEAMWAVRQLRKDGVPAFFTIDAGPHVKVLCNPEHEEVVVERLRKVPGVVRILRSGVGGSARGVDDDA